MNVVNFSGGKDSTAMLFLMLEKKIPVDKIVCIDTSKEFPAMYRHIQQVQSMIDIKIDIIPMDFDYWFEEHIKVKGKNKGQKGYGWPGLFSRWCTGRKIDLIKSVTPEGSTSFVGIAADEPTRWKKMIERDDTVRMPLFEWGMDEQQALDYCYNLGFHWDGLYKKVKRLSCWCCPLTNLTSLRMIYSDFPDIWQKLLDMDKKSCLPFRKDYTLDELTKKFASRSKK